MYQDPVTWINQDDSYSVINVGFVYGACLLSTIAKSLNHHFVSTNFFQASKSHKDKSHCRTGHSHQLNPQEFWKSQRPQWRNQRSQRSSKGVFKKTQLGQYQQELWNAVWMRREMASTEELLWVTPRRVGRNVLTTNWLATIFSSGYFPAVFLDLSQPSEKKLNLHTWQIPMRSFDAQKNLAFWSSNIETWRGAQRLEPSCGRSKSWLAQRVPARCRMLWMLRL